MYNKHAFAQYGAAHGRRQHPFMRSAFLAPVNVYKTDKTVELLVFAPGRVKENFSVKTKGTELIVSYTPPEGFPRPEWILREYSRGGFTRTFTLNESIDTAAITAKYVDGVLQVSLPVIEGKETLKKEIVIN